jgi:hypothetical protein
MNAGQYEGIMRVLREIRDRMPPAPVAAPKPLTVHHLDGSKTTTDPAPVRTGWPHERYGPAPVPAISRDLDGTVSLTPAAPRTLLQEGKEGASLALYSLLVNLDGWIRGAKDNHEGMSHRNENTGEECWRQYAPDDIRSMVNDVARELGLDEFPAPTHPEEDKAL